MSGVVTCHFLALGVGFRWELPRNENKEVTMDMATARIPGAKPALDGGERFKGRLVLVQTEQEAQMRRQTERVSLVFDHFCSCSGNVEYVSDYVLDVPVEEAKLGGQNPRREALSCVCLSCGKKDWNLYAAPFRDQLFDHRNRTED
jgi:hypothetical protein